MIAQGAMAFNSRRWPNADPYAVPQILVALKLTRQVTIQAPTGPRRRPAWFMTTSASPFTATALSDAHPYVHTRP
jgi:hypothetical protein